MSRHLPLQSFSVGASLDDARENRAARVGAGVPSSNLRAGSKRRPYRMGFAMLLAALPSFPGHAADAPVVDVLQRGEARPYLGMPAQPVFARSGEWTTEPAFPNVTFRNPVFLEPEPGTRRLLVGELEGRIYALDGANHATDEKRLVLDLSDHTQGGWDAGLLGLAYHPEYAREGSPNRGFVYVFYSWAEQPVVTGRPASDMPTRSRLARFKIDPATGIAARDSELVLIDQRDRFVIHAGGGMFFHPQDGFLYLSVGDEGGAGSPQNVQRIDRNLFSGVLRLDVDQRGGAISHPIRTRPASGETAHYFIPNDNPFVGVPGALEEFFAIGLRSPHRMTYDPVDNLAWIGEIGMSTLEEIVVLEFDRRPLNFQWDLLEGSRPGPGTTDRPKPLGIWTDPFFEYGKDDGHSVIGGYVYRGSRYPSLQGKYICGDFTSGKLWALSYTKGAPPRLERKEELGATTSINYNYRGTEGGLTSFGQSHDGELYLLLHGYYTRIARMVPSAPRASNIPPLLSQTGVFDDVKTLTPAAGLVPYAVNHPQWTDGVPAQRWLSVPLGKQIRFTPDGRATLPPGSVLVQHFEVPAAMAANDQVFRLETRLLVALEDGSYYGVGYRWKADHSDADFIATDGARSYVVKSEVEKGRSQSWGLSSPQKCMECHTAGAGFALGLKTRQLDREVSLPDGRSESQLPTWTQRGLLTAPSGEKTLAKLNRLARIDEASASVEHRVRSYLDVNCAHCHGSSPVRATWDGNFSTPLAEQRLIFGPLVGEHAGPGHHVVAPKDVAGSSLFRRGTSRDPIARMPPLGANSPDPEFGTLLHRWIEEMPREERDPPEIVGARRRSETTIELTFSEALRPDAESAQHYRLSAGAEVQAARLGEDRRTVTLTTTSLRAGQPYLLTVTGITDRAEKPNAIAAGTSVQVLR